MRVLITGITGFVGGHLAERLVAEGGHVVFGFSRSAEWPNELSHLKDHVELRKIDLVDTSRLETTFRDLQPDWIFHLAGYASPGKSFREPDACWAVNLGGTRSLFTAVERAGVRPRILLASTGLVYGDPEPGQDAFDERAPLRPASPYAASKAAADLLGYQVTRNPGLDVVRVRMFNQIGPRQTADYAIANFARQIAAIERGSQPPVLETGDLSARRDLTDVRDVTVALRRLLESAPRGEVYNVGSGRVGQMSEILDTLLGLSTTPIDVRQTIDPNRGADTAVSRADPRKTFSTTGWQPSHPMTDSLRDILNYWRSRT